MAKKLAVALGVFVFVVATGGPVRAQNKCQGTKISLAGKNVACRIGLEKKEAASGMEEDSIKEAKCGQAMSSAFAKTEGKGGCLTGPGTTASDIQAKVETIVGQIETIAGEPGTIANAKCDGTKMALAGKKVSCLLALEGKLASKLTDKDPVKVAKCRSAFSAGFAKAETKPPCTSGPSAATIEADVDAFVADVAKELNPCNCCTRAKLKFTTGVPQPKVVTGQIIRTDGTVASSPILTSGGLYFGGGSDTVPLPSTVPDQGTSVTKISGCSTSTGAFTISSTNTTDISGSHPNRTCTAAGVTNPEYPGQGGTLTGCLFGPPLPIPNANNTPLSTCVINRVTTSASGAGNCNGSSDISIPLGSDLYLDGDLLTAVAGIQPCPICTSGTCKGGPNDGQACTPADGALGAAFPTTHDCPPPPAQFIGTLPIPFALTTGTASKTSADLTNQGQVFCGFCGNSATATWKNPLVPCTSNTDCTSFTTGCGTPGTSPCKTCKQHNPGAFKVGPARTVTETGFPAGGCISNDLSHKSTLVSIFCIPPTCPLGGTNPPDCTVGPCPCGTSSVDAAADIPGPGAVSLGGLAQGLP